MGDDTSTVCAQTRQAPERPAHGQSRHTLPPIILHGLRHPYATLLLQAGVPLKVVSERLSHSTPAFTMATYQHVLPGMQADAAATFAALVPVPTG